MRDVAKAWNDDPCMWAKGFYGRDAKPIVHRDDLAADPGECCYLLIDKKWYWACMPR